MYALEHSVNGKSTASIDLSKSSPPPPNTFSGPKSLTLINNRASIERASDGSSNMPKKKRAYDSSTGTNDSISKRQKNPPHTWERPKEEGFQVKGAGLKKKQGPFSVDDSADEL